TLDLDVVHSLGDLRAQLRLAGPDIDFPAMPGAGNRRPLHGPFSERPSLMRADPINGGDHAVDIVERVDSALELDFLGGPGRELAQARQLYEARHAPLSGPAP